MKDEMMLGTDLLSKFFIRIIKLLMNQESSARFVLCTFIIITLCYLITDID